ncbi:MAG: hypothetical protein NCW75_14010 [Phycisphaera sp.]|nr:MAG: hypothetical protein NCW75_14010 [Phycisphaera sp.]
MGRSANELKPRSSVSRLLACVGFLVGLVVVADVVGLPHVRWESRTSADPRINTVLYAEYWTLTGPTKLGGPLSHEDVPVVKFMRPQPPVHQRLKQLIGRLTDAQASGQVSTHEGARHAR